MKRRSTETAEGAAVKPRKRRKSGAAAPRFQSRYSAPDFAVLAQEQPCFAKYIHTNKRGVVSLDWTDEKAILALTTAILRRDFDLDFEMPLDRLCPPVPQRLNYLHWVQDLLRITPDAENELGIDVGTGASCIFPLLGVRACHWRFVASEIDPVSITSAQRNVNANNLQDRICIVKSNAEQILIGVLPEDQSFAFCVCNPPFFSSLEETSLNLNRVCKATANELVCPGGEIAFITQMVEESAKLKHRIRWFTTMLGRKASLRPLLALIRELGPTCVRSIEFAQGKQSRWGLAWTFSEDVKKQLLASLK